MALPFLDKTAKRREQMISVDLGERTTKAVYMQRNGNRFVLSRYAMMDAPIYEKSLSAALLAEHLKSICQVLDTRARNITLALGVGDSIMRHADLPRMPEGDMRQILRNNSKNYLQQDLPGYVFDCFVIPPRFSGSTEPEKNKAASAPKCKVLVAGARKHLIDEVLGAIRNNGLTADHIVPGMVGPVNAFEFAFPEIFRHELIALVDIGFKNTTICLVHEGEFMLSRVVGIGGHQFTEGLAAAMGISYAEADGIKMGKPQEVKSHLESLVLPLGRELRASIDFFEHQQDKAVSQVFLSGGSTQSELILQTLQKELMVECKPWNPLGFMDLSLPPQQAAEVQQLAPHLAVAVGAAMTAF